jgi:hypothetical protein
MLGRRCGVFLLRQLIIRMVAIIYKGESLKYTLNNMGCDLVYWFPSSFGGEGNLLTQKDYNMLKRVRRSTTGGKPVCFNPIQTLDLLRPVTRGTI